MTIKIMQADNNLNQEELDFFVKGDISLEKSSRRKPYTWLSDQGWQDILKLCNVAPNTFGNLADDIERNEEVWKEVLCRTTYYFIALVERRFPIYMCEFSHQVL